ncbi:sensor domain-containing diguanylate cyclase [Paenibacillus thiaminolyticus]|uniref:sensor domain-containing diguanylate cyclase n=1 Tax=Paenibacillus thiaminolyticus TaxID=49283 RepID=UPI000E0619DF|nr:sensor domain-containing diguanylate cyclase [Paenibacillus thiaminolyticus]SUA95157.1 GAF sensor-containing diguanylate cyclase [Paenibacillus thiaminolyticus]
MTERLVHHQPIESDKKVAGTNGPVPNGTWDPPPRPRDSWVLQRDVNVHDFPYVQPLLQSAYKEWAKELPARACVLRGRMALFDYAGKWMAGDSELTGEATAERAAAAALQEGTLAVRTGFGLSYAACPLLNKREEGYAAVVCRLDEEPDESFFAGMDAWVYGLRTHFYRQFELVFVDELERTLRTAERELKRRDVLHGAIRHMHDRINVDAVLSQIMSSVEQLVPEARIEVYLSQDHISSNPKVKPLLFQPGSDGVVRQAFMKGEICYERDGAESDTEVGFALCGKQGAYGVIKVSFPGMAPDPSDVQLIQLIVETAGTAFENARLHEQANEVIQELRFINDLTKRINQSLRLRDVFHNATHELLRVFRADFCMLLQLNEERQCYEVVSCNMDEFDDAYLSFDEGLFGHMYLEKEPVIVSDIEVDVPASMQFFEKLNYHSVIAAPLFGSGEMVGIVILADQRKQFFTYDNFKLLQMLATHIGLAIANAALHSRVKHLANKDQLTGLYARHYLDKQIQRQQKNDFCGSLIVVDIDYFKQINDRYGHQVGDKILNQVSQIIRSSIRESDIAARWGGEEMAIYLPQLSISQTIRVAERIRTRVANETEPHVTVSCGIADWSWQDDMVSVESLFYRADMALYEAKDSGRNQIRIST